MQYCGMSSTTFFGGRVFSIYDRRDDWPQQSLANLESHERVAFAARPTDKTAQPLQNEGSPVFQSLASDTTHDDALHGRAVAHTDT